MSYTFESDERTNKLTISLNKLVLLACFFVIIYYGNSRYERHKTEQTVASELIQNPQVSDIYFLDMSILKGDVEGKNKYKLAKVIRVTDDNVAIVYGKFSYQWQYSVINSIQYGDLSNDDYFMSLPDYISLDKIKKIRSNGAIYLIKRPVRNQLYSNFVRP